MKIEIKKKTPYKCEYKIIRDDKSVGIIDLETKTYLIHDICHYVVEKNLYYLKGFWGMLSSGHSFNELLGKDNPQTTELRLIEKIVGPVQSVHLGYIAKQDFHEHIGHLHFTMSDNILSTCLTEIKTIIDHWEELTTEQLLTLEWEFY